MDQASIRLFDDLNVGDIVEVDWRAWCEDVRTSVGPFGGYERHGFGAWYLVVSGKLTIRTIDVVAVRRLPTLQTAE